MKNAPQEELSVAEAAASPQRGSRRPIYWTAVVLIVAAAIGVWYWQRPASTGTPMGTPTKGGRFDAARPFPVSAAAVRTADLPVRLTALGTVTARSTVTVRSRVDGQLDRVFFKEGDHVKAGQLLAQIDPRPFQVALEQAESQQARDAAQLESAKVDLDRYRGLLATDSIARQQVDQQAALVRQLEATVAADKAAADNARLQLSFTRVSAPVAGRTGLRQVDPGNLIHAADANGLVVVTQVEPIDVVFSLPQENLPAVLARLRSGAALSADAYGADGSTRLATGRLMTVDNLIDPTTGTVKMKAEFDNRDGALFPNQFVNVRLLLDTLKNAVVVPTSAIQRGAPGTYVYVVRDDSTVSVRKVTLGPADGETASIAAGLTAGERVVSDGADKLREGAKVEVIDRNAAPAAAPPAGAGKHGAGKRREAPKQ